MPTTASRPPMPITSASPMRGGRADTGEIMGPLSYAGQRRVPGTELVRIGPYIGRNGGPGRFGPKADDGYRYPYAWVFSESSNPDLRPFKATGGKMIVFQGW